MRTTDGKAWLAGQSKANQSKQHRSSLFGPSTPKHLPLKAFELLALGNDGAPLQHICDGFKVTIIDVFEFEKFLVTRCEDGSAKEKSALSAHMGTTDDSMRIFSPNGLPSLLQEINIENVMSTALSAQINYFQ